MPGRGYWLFPRPRAVRDIFIEISVNREVDMIITDPEDIEVIKAGGAHKYH